MKIYKIILYNKATRETTKVEDFPDTPSYKDLRKRLLELQEDYCRVNDVPVVSEQKISSDGSMVKVLIARSDSNYWHIAQI